MVRKQRKYRKESPSSTTPPSKKKKKKRKNNQKGKEKKKNIKQQNKNGGNKFMYISNMENVNIHTIENHIEVKTNQIYMFQQMQP